MNITNTIVIFAAVTLVVGTQPAGTEDLGNGSFHHGVATPLSNHRGTVATVDGSGRDVVLIWLFDHRGGYALLLIDAETGKSEEFPSPFLPGEIARTPRSYRAATSTTRTSTVFLQNSTSPGTGGEKKAKEAELYIMDMATKKVDWHQVVFPGVQEYSDLCMGQKGLIYGIADRKMFFVFDAVSRTVVYERDVAADFGLATGQQGPRILVRGEEGTIYVLFGKGITRVEPTSYALTLLAQSPVRIDAGGDYLDGRIFLASGSHLYSYEVKK